MEFQTIITKAINNHKEEVNKVIINIIAHNLKDVNYTQATINLHMEEVSIVEVIIDKIISYNSGIGFIKSLIY
jgi:hypothetical protein